MYITIHVNHRHSKPYLCLDFIQNEIIESGFLPELSILLDLNQYPDLQCHVAGTIRNLAAENKYIVSNA